ncbi:MAG: hypothetical protein PHP95_11110 [Desulfuromonadaceae bacterium]|nr:hypothetical protein [Desulfuromonadaceae bacterium]MDD2848995.1 hypothetical protein [Desulfuromonadaceae bacterium]MDD4130344.1 hypothetical protein [Desulfuromonadaceae bacterium]
MIGYREIMFIVLFVLICSPRDVQAFARDINGLLAQQMQGDGQKTPAFHELKSALNDEELSLQLLQDRSRIHAILQSHGLRQELMQHPRFIRQMLQVSELRQELLQNEQVMHEMIGNRDVRCELERNQEMMAEIEKRETYRQEYLKQEADLLRELLMEPPESGSRSRFPVLAHEQ